jgi:hypothetical protein
MNKQKYSGGSVAVGGLDRCRAAANLSGFGRGHGAWRMGGKIEVRCRCGEVRGTITNASPRTVNRVTCYCDDCQAFAHQLGRADLLNDKGGSDIVQVAPATLRFSKGQDRIAGLRLSPKGLYRWHTTCCNTPIGNTLSPAVPFVGLIAQTLDVPRLDDAVGAPTGAILGKYAVGEPPAGSTGFNPSLVLRVIRRVLGWRLGGKTWPHPFFARDTRAPIYPLTVISRERREALRAFCGPRPTAA